MIINTGADVHTAEMKLQKEKLNIKMAARKKARRYEMTQEQTKAMAMWGIFYSFDLVCNLRFVSEDMQKLFFKGKSLPMVTAFEVGSNGDIEPLRMVLVPTN